MLRWLLATVVMVHTALAGPFAKVDTGSPIYGDLEVLVAAGLCRSPVVDYRPGVALTRYELALLWRAAYDRVTEIEARADARVEPRLGVRRVADALGRLLEALGPELDKMDVDRAVATALLRRLPARVTGFDVPPAAAPDSGPAWPAALREAPPPALVPALAPSGVSVGPAPGATGLTLHTRREPVAGTAARYGEDVGARLSTGRIGPAEAGLSWTDKRVFDLTAQGPSELLGGQVLAADLRLSLGDHSVLLEYARSMSDEMTSLLGDDAGRAFAATFMEQVGDHLKLDLGFRRLSSSFSPLAEVSGGARLPDLYGVEARVAWHGDRLGFESGGSVFRPEGTQVGYTKVIDASLGYRIARDWRVKVGFQTMARRRLAQLEDAAFNTLTTSLTFGGARSVRADLVYRFDTNDLEQGDRLGGHTVGGSLGLGF